MKTKMMVAVAVLIAGQAWAQGKNVRRPAPPQPSDVYYAYFVKTYVVRNDAPPPVEPEKAVPMIVITEGPMSFSEGLERSRVILAEGVCRILGPSVTDPGRATCYPARRVSLVDVVSP